MSFRKVSRVLVLVWCMMIFGIASSFAAEEIRFVKVSWTGVSVKTFLAKNVLESLGYKVSIKNLSVPIVYKALEMGDADVFLGNWMPSMATIAEKSFKSGKVIQYCVNMPNAKYTLAAPAYVVDGGVKDFADIAQYADKFDHKIYGLESGNDGNLIIQKMIDENQFNLGDFTLVATSEPIMLAEIKAMTAEKKWALFLGWSPHYMNQILDMKYLTGSTEKTFGANDGTATIYTNIRQGFAEEQPNIALFLKNLNFPIAMINEISLMLHKNKKLDYDKAGVLYIKKHPEIYKKWLKGVKSRDGKEALPVFTEWLDKQ